MFAINIEKLKTLKYHIFSLVFSKCGQEYQKIIKEEESIKILKRY